MATWTQEGKVWRRADGVEVNGHGNGGIRTWQAIRGRRTYLRARLFAGMPAIGANAGPVRTFKTAEAAMRAVDKDWPYSPTPAVKIGD